MMVMGMKREEHDGFDWSEFDDEDDDEDIYVAPPERGSGGGTR